MRVNQPSLLIKHAEQLATVGGPNAARCGPAQADVEIIADGAIYCEGERIVAVGTTRDVLSEFPRAKKARTIIDATGHAVIPGLVDCHAHPVFAGDRSDEYEMKLAGKTYREILAAGGGILRSVRATRAASPATLLLLFRQRLDAALALGTTTLECKSGYGLDEATECKILQVVRTERFGENHHPIDLVPTLMFAHAVPEGSTADEVVKAAVESTPRLAKLAEFVDVFCERGIFDVEQSRQVLQAGQRAGLGVKVHADELCQFGGAKLAAELGAVSADHLLYADDESITAMKRANTIAVMLPGTPFVLRAPYAGARRFISANVPVAVASDFNPNCYCQSLPFCFALAVYEMKMTPAEALIAVTINAAAVLRRETEIGSLTPGKLADILILKGPSYLHLGYHLGDSPVNAVVKRGAPVSASVLNRRLKSKGVRR